MSVVNASDAGAFSLRINIEEFAHRSGSTKTTENMIVITINRAHSPVYRP
jgi:hypothetical protein